MLQPLVRRTWAPKGQTPIIRCWDRRDRLSVSAAITVPPTRERHRLKAFFRIQDRNVKTNDTLAFLRGLERQVRGPMIVVLDRLNVHKAAVRRWLAGRRRDGPRVMIEWLPPYAPDLNPVEQIWNNGKRVNLANLAPHDAADLRRHVRRSLIRQRCRPNLLASFFDHAGLSL
jgi:transposase